MKVASLIFITIVIGSFSCNHSKIKGLLENVNNIIESYPDSALLVLESVNSPEQLSRKEDAEFTLAYLKAKDKCYLDLAGDTTAANNLIDFYKDQRNNPTTGWAYYYAGRVFHDANKEETASTYYIEASKYAPKASDSKLGIMANYYLAEFHAKQFAFKEALAAYQQALNYCGLTKERKFETILLSSVGYTFGLNQQIDSALIYLRKANLIAVKQNDTDQIANTANDLSNFLLENQQYQEAKTYLIKSIEIYPDSIIPTQYITLAELFLHLNKADSAILTLNKIKDTVLNSTDLELKTIYYQIACDIERARNNYSLSLDYCKLYANYQDSIYQEKRRNSLAEIEHIHNYIKTNEQNTRLISEKKIVLSIISVLLVLFILLFYILRQRIIQRENSLMEAEEKLNMLQLLLNETQNQKAESENIKDLNNEEKELLFKNLIVQKLDIATKIALIHAQNPDKSQPFLEKFNEIMYGKQRPAQLNWEELYPLLNILYGNFVTALQSNYKKLSEKDIQLCCLLFVDLNTAEIVFIMEQSINTVHKRKTDIRKKLNMTEGADIATFLKENIAIPPREQEIPDLV